MKPYTTLLFDMGNVLIDFDPKAIVAHYVQDPQDRILLELAIFHGKEWASLDLGSLSDDQAIDSIQTKLPVRFHPIVETIVKTWPSTNVYRSEMIPLVKALKEKGLHLYLASNASLRFYDYAHEIQALAWFDGIQISAAIHQVKPDLAFYQSLLNRFDLDPTSCFMIDDRKENIEGAAKAGIDGFVYDQDLSHLMEVLNAKKIL